MRGLLCLSGLSHTGNTEPAPVHLSRTRHAVTPGQARQRRASSHLSNTDLGRLYLSVLDDALGLDVEFGGRGIGWDRTSLARGTLTRYRAELDQLDRAMTSWEPVSIRKGSRRPVKMVCSCSPPRILRTSAGTAAGPGIRCEKCGELFVTASA